MKKGRGAANIKAAAPEKAGPCRCYLCRPSMAPSGWAARDADARARARGRIQFGEAPTGGPARRYKRSARREILAT